MVNGEFVLFILWTNTATHDVHVARLTRRPGRGLHEAIFNTRPDARPGWIITRVAGWNVPEQIRGPLSPDGYLTLATKPVERPLVPDPIRHLLIADGETWSSGGVIMWRAAAASSDR